MGSEKKALMIALMFDFKTPLALCMCMQNIYAKKNQNAKVSFRKVSSKTITLSIWTPEEVDIVSY